MANALLNHLKFLFLGFLWRLHAVKLSLAWCEDAYSFKKYSKRF
ncbi:hypothetical protein MWE_0027 [Helicobacter pylori XZ274]|nr:hypothetical protein MWE_0027 [Helicobacter pylori XZ274]